MSSPLEKFILENREQFDTDAPDSRIWEKISERMDPRGKDKIVPLRSIPFKRWLSAAAAVVILFVSGLLYFTMHQNKVSPEIANKRPVPVEPSNNLPVPSKSTDTAAVFVQSSPDITQKTNPAETLNASSDIGENKEMYYYAKLIEIKHEELKTLEKDEPLLYRQFAGDVQKLDSVYHSLKTQLPNNSNREQVIEAMISNLQLQIGLLNKQLGIIKQIKNSKKSAYEKAYKSV
jgi:hypothetical protein